MITLASDTRQRQTRWKRFTTALLFASTVLFGCGAHSGPPDKDVVIDWVDVSGKERLQMRVPRELVRSASRDSQTPYGKRSDVTGGDKNNGIYSVVLEGALGDASSTTLLPLETPPTQLPTVPWVRIMLKADHGAWGMQWKGDSKHRSLNAYSINAGDMRRLPDKFGLEHYRPQACGERLPKDVDKHPLLPDEEARPNCRDLATGEEYMTPPDTADGLFIQCEVYGPFECRAETTFAGWYVMYMFPRDQVERWRETHQKVMSTLASFVTPAS